MHIELDRVDVARMSEETELDEDEIRAAFGVYTRGDSEIIAKLANTKNFAAVRELYMQSNPDTAFVKDGLAQVLVDLATVRDQLWAVLDCVVSNERVAEQAWSRLLTMTEDRDDLVEIATQSTTPETVTKAILRLAEFYTK